MSDPETWLDRLINAKLDAWIADRPMFRTRRFHVFRVFAGMGICEHICAVGGL